MVLRWLARGAAHVPEELTWLSAGERAYVESKPFRKRSSEFLIARWTMKSAVAAQLGLSPHADTYATIEARHAADGAPELYVEGSPAGLDVSLTDRADWAVCVLGDAGAGIGVDLELVEPRSAAFVRDYLTDAERDLVTTAGSAELHDLAANLVWSAKESALKVLRTGLRRDTRSVAVSVQTLVPEPGCWSPLAVTTEEGETFNGWWRRTGAFVLTTCTRSQDLAPPSAIEAVSPFDDAVPTHRWLDEPRASPRSSAPTT